MEEVDQTCNVQAHAGTAFDFQGRYIAETGVIVVIVMSHVAKLMFSFDLACCEPTCTRLIIIIRDMKIPIHQQDILVSFLLIAPIIIVFSYA